MNKKPPGPQARPSMNKKRVLIYGGGGLKHLFNMSHSTNIYIYICIYLHFPVKCKLEGQNTEAFINWGFGSECQTNGLGGGNGPCAVHSKVREWISHSSTCPFDQYIHYVWVANRNRQCPIKGFQGLRQAIHISHFQLDPGYILVDPHSSF